MITDTNSQARTGNDISERVTNQIITAIEAGAGEYRMPWHHDGSAITTPLNGSSPRRASARSIVPRPLCAS